MKNMTAMCALGYLASGGTAASKPEFASSAHVAVRPRFVGGTQPVQACNTDIETVLSAPFDERSP